MLKTNFAFFKRTVECEIKNKDQTVKIPTRIQFFIHKNDSDKSNKGIVTLFNIGKSLRKFVNKKGSQVTIKAGYSGDIGQIIKADIVEVQDGLNDGDILTKLKVGDGHSGITESNIIISEKEIHSTNLLKKCLEEFLKYDLDVSIVNDLKQNKLLENQCFSGNTIDLFKEILNDNGSKFKIEDSKIIVYDDKIPSSIVFLDEESGLLEILKKDDKFIVTTLLNHRIKIDQPLRVKNKFYDKTIFPKSITIQGDSEEGPFYYSIEGIEK